MSLDKFLYRDETGYQWIIRKKEKGLALFHKVVKQLQEVENELVTAKEHCEEQISEHQDQIDKFQIEILNQKDAIAFLEKEYAHTGYTKAKINRLLGKEGEAE